jgi:FKBP-type peptidyl-prolyl cis-trans isomerase FkpA
MRFPAIPCAALALLLAACSSSSTSNSEAPAAEPAATPEPAAPATADASVSPAAPAPPPIDLRTDEQKTIYALGLSVSRSLSMFDLSPEEVEIVKRALSDSLTGKPALELDTWGPKIDPLARSRQTRAAAKERERSKTYLTTAAAEKGAVKSASGLIYKELRAGSGSSPKTSDRVSVNYRGTLVNGTEFDSSYKRGQPAQFPLDGVIPCWTEGVQKMKVGGKAQLVCPSDIAYGEQGTGNIPGGATLIFEVELLDII